MTSARPNQWEDFSSAGSGTGTDLLGMDATLGKEAAQKMFSQSKESNIVNNSSNGGLLLMNAGTMNPFSDSFPRSGQQYQQQHLPALGGFSKTGLLSKTPPEENRSSPSMTITIPASSVGSDFLPLASPYEQQQDGFNGGNANNGTSEFDSACIFLYSSILLQF